MRQRKRRIQGEVERLPAKKCVSWDLDEGGSLNQDADFSSLGWSQYISVQPARIAAFFFTSAANDGSSASTAALSSSRSCDNLAIASLSSRSYCRYAFLPRDIEATMCARAAAIAPAAAEALPPPGVAVGAARFSTNGSMPARNPPT